MVKALRCLFSRQGKGQRSVPWRNEMSFPCLSLHVKPEAPCVRAWRQSPCWPCTRPVPALVPGPYTLERKAVLAPPLSSRMNCHMNSRRGIGPGVACVPGAQPRVSSRAAGRSFSAGTDNRLRPLSCTRLFRPKAPHARSCRFPCLRHVSQGLSKGLSLGLPSVPGHRSP